MNPLSSRRLILFDIDGTLTESMSVDTECFVRAFRDVFQIDGIDTDWSRYRHTTDPGILEELFESQFGRAPTGTEVAAFQKHFFALLYLAAGGTPFHPIPGALELLAHLRASNEAIAFATGAWGVSARLKLSTAGFPLDGLVMATADDAVSREDILRRAIRRACAAAGCKAFPNVVYLGDGLWDARTCRKLGIPLIGIGQGEHGGRLKVEGAAEVLPDFRDLAATLAVIDRLTAL